MNYYDYVTPAKKTLKWFIDYIGEAEWAERRQRVIGRFKDELSYSLNQNISNLSVSNIDNIPIEFSSDIIAWYMYLVESLMDRPTCDEPFQSSRIYPFFAEIGNGIEILCHIPGIKDRLRVLLNVKQNKPDTTLFELTTALLYCKNGWQVRFLEETPLKKTPDFVVSKDGQEYFVECKRLDKVNGYTVLERLAWLERWDLLLKYLVENKRFMHISVEFSVPIETTPKDILVKLYKALIEKGGKEISENGIELRAEIINLKKLKLHFEHNYTRQNSPQMICLVVGEYDPHCHYSQYIISSENIKIGDNDGLHILNIFCGGIREVYSSQWLSLSNFSISRKAKDLTKSLSKAVTQIPDGKLGIIHIGYETVSGALVEMEREIKIKKAIRSFDFGEKRILSVFCHAINAYPTLEGHECVATTMNFGELANEILPFDLLLAPIKTSIRETTHWREDFWR